jgi:hypothetical protein
MGSGSLPAGSIPRDTMDEISFEELGVNFVTHVVTPERVAATIAHVAGSEVRVGPMNAGPGGAASVSAVGKVGTVTAGNSFREGLSFDAMIPIDISLDVRIAGASHKYKGKLSVPLHITLRAVAPVILRFDIDPVQPDEVRVELSAEGVRAKVLQRIGGIDEEVRRAVASTVTERLDAPRARAVREIDILQRVTDVWEPGG